MASINLKGYLRETLGSLSAGNKLRFTHGSTTGETIAGSVTYYTVADDGYYDIDIEYGNVFIESRDKSSHYWLPHGTVTINQDTAATTLPTLLNSVIPPTDDQILLFQTIAAGAEAAKDEAEAAAVAASNSASVIPIAGGMVVNRLDDNGNWNVMVKIPAFTNKMVNDKLGTNWLPEADLHPAFVSASGNKTHFEIAMYCASNDGSGNPVSAPHKAPYIYVNWDSAKAKCQSMGSDWDLCGNAQWAATVIWCLMNDYQSLGNTYYGQSHEQSWQSGIRQDGGIAGDASGTAIILAGSGPLSWRHNNSPLGISDLVGNVWEWQDGMKMSEGQILVALEQQAAEASWSAQAAYLDAGNKLNSSKTASASADNDWRTTGKDVSYVENQLLQQLLIEPIAGTDVALGRLDYDNNGDRFPRRGGRWGSSESAGLGALDLRSESAYASSGIGFRPAFFGD